MKNAPKNKLWPNTSAIVVSDESNLYLLMKELVRSSGWRIDMPPCSPSAAIDHINNGSAGCVIVIDSPTYPAHESLRVMFRDHRARLTPTMVMIPESHKFELTIFDKIFRVTVATKPLTPNNFIPSFRKMLRAWETPVMHTLRKVSYLYGSEHNAARKAILEKLIENPSALPYALPALTQIMIAEGLYKEAEKLILDKFRIHAKNPLMLAYCAWFYIEARMPHQAIKYLVKLKSIAPMSNAFNFDLATSHLACGQLGEALNVMREWHERHPGNGFMETFIARLLVAEGRQDMADSIGIPKGMVRKISDIWDVTEAPRAVESTQITGLKVS